MNRTIAISPGVAAVPIPPWESRQDESLISALCQAQQNAAPEFEALFFPQHRYHTAIGEMTVSTGNVPLPAIGWLRSDVGKITASSDSFSKLFVNCYFVQLDDVTTKAAPIPAQPKAWWENAVYDLVAKGEETKALRAMYRSVEDLFAKRNLEVLEKSLGRVELKRLTPELMVALIRVTYRGRRALPSWKAALERIKAELQAQHVPRWQDLLVGLE